MGTISKSLNLLNFFSADLPEIGLSEFRKLSGQDKATVHRHLTELSESGFLEQNPATRAYRLGPAILRLAAVREALFPTRSAVAPIVREMAESLGELVHMSLRQGDELSPLFHHDAKVHGTRVHLDEAEMLPLHATSSGIVQLAFGPDDLLAGLRSQTLKRWTERTIVDHDVLVDAVSQARDTGIAHSDQGFELDVCSFAAPVFGIGEHAIGSLAVALPTTRRTEENAQRITDALKPGAIDVTERLGGVFPDDLRRIWQDD